MKLFLDTNVLLDGYFARAGAVASDTVISRCDGSPDSGWIAWHSLSNAFYLVQGHSKCTPTALRFITDLLAWVEVVETSKVDAEWAVRSGMSDFEDAMQLSAAMACGADGLITRNKADFQASIIPVMTPEEYLMIFPQDCKQCCGQRHHDFEDFTADRSTEKEPVWDAPDRSLSRGGVGEFRGELRRFGTPTVKA